MDPVTCGKRVSARLDQLGLTQKWLAEQIGMREGDLSKRLSGAPAIDHIEAWRMARVLGLTEFYILYGNRQGLPAEIYSALPAEN